MATTASSAATRPRAIGPAMLRVTLGLAWALVLVAGVCSEAPRYAEVALATS